MSATLKNLELALAGESTAHIKYRYFAKLARAEGFTEIAEHFEKTAEQEIQHAWSHLELLVGKPSTTQCLEKAIEGETYEYTQMYPQFESIALREGELNAAKSAAEQIAESKQHAQEFADLLKKAKQRFAALAKVEQRHADAYKDLLTNLSRKL